MLTTMSRLRIVRVLGTLLLLFTAVVATQGTVTATAQPPGCWFEIVDLPGGGVDYKTVCPGGEDGGGGGGGGGGEGPACDLSQAPFDEFCYGSTPCWGNDPAAVQDPTQLAGVPKPSPDAHVAFRSCRNPDGSSTDTWWWSTGGGEPPIITQARQALGEIDLPGFTLAFNPPQRTIVTLDTWWWVDGPTDAEIVGSSAFGVVAIATPSRVEVDPGDGSAVLTCPFATAASEACSYVYRRASVAGSATAAEGSPAYAAQARLVYDIRFEDAGAPITVPGVPTQLESPWANTAVPVAEIQSLVTSHR